MCRGEHGRGVRLRRGRFPSVGPVLARAERVNPTASLKVGLGSDFSPKTNKKKRHLFKKKKPKIFTILVLIFSLQNAIIHLKAIGNNFKLFGV